MKKLLQIPLVQSLVIAGVLSLIILSLPGCETEPVIKTVKKNQDYEIPRSFVVRGIGNASIEEISEKCNGHINGCLIPMGNGIYYIYFTADNVSEHEFDHLVYGPEHN